MYRGVWDGDVAGAGGLFEDAARVALHGRVGNALEQVVGDQGPGGGTVLSN